MSASKLLKPALLEPGPLDYSLPSLPSEPAMTTVEAARLLGYSPAALRKWRREGRGPRYLRTGRSIRYLPADLRAWQARHLVDPARGDGGGDEKYFSSQSI